MFLFFPDDLLFLKAVLLLICCFTTTQVLAQFSGPNETPSSSSSTENGEADTIQQLVAEPDYRAVRLRWQYLTARRTDEVEKENRPLYFIIRYCELAQWQSKRRCKEQRLPVEQQQQQQQQPPPNEFKRFRSLASGESDDAVVLSPIRVVAPDREREEHRAFQRLDLEVTLANLRMLTKYSVGVRADSANDVPGARRGAEVFVQTKSFSAKTSRCLANSSVIEVHTGPYFGGKISVEGAGEEDAARCARFGNRSSSQATYTLAIDHQLCGSKIINKTRIETMVIVHENRDILTHNSRRYLVLCTFTPQLYSLTASASVPSHLLRKVIDRLREKRLPFRLELLKTTKAEKKLKKRHSSSNNTAAKQSLDGAASLRDSRMIAEGTDEKGRKNISIQEDQTESNLGSSSAVPVVSSSSPSSSSTTSSAVAISTIFCLSAATAALAAFLAQKRSSSSSSSSNEATFSRKEEEEDSSKLNEKISVVVAAVMEA